MVDEKHEQSCDHECVNKENGVFVTLVSSGVALIFTLILASFAYTWSEVKAQDEEKKEWRKEHQQVLDKKFEEVKQAQKELASEIRQDTDKTQQLLQQLLEEQRKYYQRRTQ